MSEQILLKRADSGDWKAILSLYASLDEEDLERRFFNLHRLNPEEARQMAGRSGHYTLLALSGETLIGEATLERDGEIAVVVAKSWRNHGIASLLVKELIQVGRTEGFSRLWFLTLTGNLRMVGLGKALGFHVISHSNMEEKWVLDL